MTIYSCSQTVFQERRILAELFGLKEVDVHIIKPLVGAGFGARQQLHAQHAAALISRKIKRPVKLLYSREEDFYSVVRHASDVDLRIGADKNGKLQLFDTTFRLNAGPSHHAHADRSWPPPRVNCSTTCRTTRSSA